MTEHLSSVTSAPSDLVELGRVSGSYGIRGWIKIEPFSSQSEVLLQARRWWVRTTAHGEPQAWAITQVRPQGASMVAEVAGIDSREQAAAFKGSRILVSRAEFPAPEADEFYWVDLIGCQVQGEDEAGIAIHLGHVAQVSDNGAHGILHVCRTQSNTLQQPLLDAKGREDVVLVPFVAAHVLSVSLDERQIVTNWPSDV